ncbi:MAG: tetraacyldisaccharide 4'-kinase [Candidatus Hydrogenedentes bacterium]|nr:tetraacyldisaccharide 4'-kinase [Candidatus Hydrogenedentota bacterium]
MSHFNDIAARVRRGEPLPRFWDLLLRAATPATRIGMHWRLRQPAERIDATVISFGNITAGGTGKTPAVIECIQQQIAAGHRVAVVTRGYGSDRVPEPFVVLPDMPRADIVRQVGDEPALIRCHAPECILVKAARRADGARAAMKQHGCDVIVLDDAYQHVQLARDRNICLIDATNPFGNGYLVPRGILREPLDALKRATEIVLTRCDQAIGLNGLRARLAEYAPGAPVRETIHAPDGLWRVADGAPVSLQNACAEPVTAIAAIGNPEAFYQTLASLGFTLKETFAFPDHAVIPGEVLKRPGLIITTEKDAMRLNAAPDNVLALRIALRDFTGPPRSGE